MQVEVSSTSLWITCALRCTEDGMTVAELIQQLQGMDPNARVIIRGAKLGRPPFTDVATIEAGCYNSPEDWQPSNQGPDSILIDS